MTDYDGTIARLKLAALHELQVRAEPPFAIAPGDKRNFYQVTLDKIIGQFAEKLMAAMIERDQNAEDARRWQGTAESLARDLDHDQNEIGRLRDALDAEREAVRVRDGWLAEKDDAYRKLQDRRPALAVGS